MTDPANTDLPPVPPTTPFEIPPDDLDGRQAAWPTVVGISSIVYAAFGVLANGCGTAFIYLGNTGLSMMGIDGADLQIPVWLKVVQTAMGLFGMGLAIMLVVGAVGLLRRRVAALRTLKVWAILAIVSSLAGIGIGFAAIQPNVELQMSIQDAIRDKIAKDGGDPNAPQFDDLNKDEETIRRESIRNLAIFGVVPIIYPAIVGFLITSRRRVDQAESWNDQAPVA